LKAKEEKMKTERDMEEKTNEEEGKNKMREKR
jgi:hypothetical protein